MACQLCVTALERFKSQSVHFGLALTKFKSTEHMRMEPVCYLHQKLTIFWACVQDHHFNEGTLGTLLPSYMQHCACCGNTIVNILGRKLESLYLLPLYRFPSLSTMVCDYTPVFLSNHMQPLLHPNNFLYALEYN